MSRDITYIADDEAAVTRHTATPPAGTAAHAHDTLSPAAPWRVVNIAGGAPKPLADFIAAFEVALGKPAIKTVLPMQPGDVSATEADVSLLRALVGYVPATPILDGVKAVVDWYRTDYARLQARLRQLSCGL